MIGRYPVRAGGSMKQVVVYLVKRRRPLLEMEAEWGTLEAISAIEGCIPVRRTARRVSADMLDSDGFIHYGMSPDDLDS
jgi:hypothetical protein